MTTEGLKDDVKGDFAARAASEMARIEGQRENSHEASCRISTNLTSIAAMPRMNLPYLQHALHLNPLTVDFAVPDVAVSRTNFPSKPPGRSERYTLNICVLLRIPPTLHNQRTSYFLSEIEL